MPRWCQLESVQIYTTVLENKTWNLGGIIQTIPLHRLLSLATNTQKWENIPYIYDAFNCHLVWYKSGIIPKCCWEEKLKKIKTLKLLDEIPESTELMQEGDISSLGSLQNEV